MTWPAIACATTSQASWQSTAYQPLSSRTSDLSERFRTKCEQSHIAPHFSTPPSSTQPSRKSNWNLQITLEKGTGGQWMPLHSLKRYIAQPHLVNRSYHPMSYCLDINPKQHSQAAEAHWSPNSQKMTFTKKLTRSDEKSRQYFGRKACSDKRPLNNQEPVFVWNALKGTWQPAAVLNRPQPTEHP